MRSSWPTRIRKWQLVSNNNIFTIPFLNTYYHKQMNKILIAAYNETFRQSSDPVYAHTPMRYVGKLRTFNPKLKDSAGGEVNKVRREGCGDNSLQDIDDLCKTAVTDPMGISQPCTEMGPRISCMLYPGIKPSRWLPWSQRCDVTYRIMINITDISFEIQTFSDINVNHTVTTCLVGVGIYRKTSGISRTKSQNLYISCLLLQWSLPNPLKPGVKLRMKI